MEPPCVSGTLACSLRDGVREAVGDDAVDRALARVPEDVRTTYESATAVSWVPIDTLETVFSEIASEVGQSVGALHESVARQSIERTMRTVWRMLLKLTSDRALVSRAPVLFGKAYNRGKLEADFPERGEAEIRMSEWPDPPEWPLRATRIGIETALRLGGRRNVVVRVTRAEDGAVFTARWDA